MDFKDTSLITRLAHNKIGHVTHILTEVDSTNKAAFDLANSGSPEGTLVIAERQMKGKGRLNRIWQSPPHCNIYMSIILRPAIAPAAAPQITLVAGVAVAQALSSCCPERVSLKWPNDVLIGGKKVCGILTEMRTGDRGVHFVIVGIGINVNMKRDDLHESFRGNATSLLEETGRPVSRTELVVALCDHLEKMYDLYSREGFAPIRALWLAHTDMVGKRIQVAFKDDIQEGEVVGMNDDGALLLSDANRELIRITAGDTTVVKNRRG